jgi:3-oxoacid CoA-transferase subunit A
VPQGTLAERLRAGGAGIPAFFTPAGVGTQVADGGLPMRYGPDGAVRRRASPGDPHLRRPRVRAGARRITGDFAIVKAWKGDRHGNLSFTPARATSTRSAPWPRG